MAPDPISIVSLTLQVLQLTVGIVQKLRDAPQQYRGLQNTILELPPVLEKIVRTVIEQEGTGLAQDFKLLTGPLEALNTPLLRVEKKLRMINSQGGTRAKRFRVCWTFWNKGEIEQLVRTLESHKGTLLTALETLHIRTTVHFGTSLEASTSDISGRVRRIQTTVLPRQQRSLDRIHGVVTGLPHQQNRIERRLRMLVIRAQRQDRHRRAALGKMKRAGLVGSRDVLVIGRQSAEDAVVAELTLMIRKAAGRTIVPSLLCAIFFFN